MYAVIRTGGKQYRVTAGDTLEVEKLEGKVGDSITLDDVLLVTNGDEVFIGQPRVDDASVAAQITGQHRGKKILSFRYRPKKRIRVRRGHRQYLTRLQIESITIGGETYTRPEETEAEAAAPRATPETDVAEAPAGGATAPAATAEPAAQAVEEEPAAEQSVAERPGELVNADVAAEKDAESAPADDAAADEHVDDEREEAERDSSEAEDKKKDE